MSDQDNFFRGASLGMNAVQAGIQAQQNRTNLAERSRQFDLSYRLNVQQQELNERRFEEQLEGYELDQKLALQRLNKNKADIELANQQLARSEAFRPQKEKFYSSLNSWDGRGDSPRIPPNSPPEDRREMSQALINTRTVFAGDKKLESIREGGVWMLENYPEQAQILPDNSVEYDYANYVNLRAAAKRRADELEFQRAKELKQTGSRPPLSEAEKAAQRRQEAFMKFLPLVTEENQAGEETVNKTKMKAYLEAYREFIETGEEKLPTLLDDMGIGEEFPNNFDPLLFP